jgi:hypothetical protein
MLILSFLRRERKFDYRIDLNYLRKKFHLLKIVRKILMKYLTLRLLRVLSL